jgi:hypothetical protein
MQSLTAFPRQGFTTAQMIALLQADDFHMYAGLDLLDTSDNFVADLTDYLRPGGQVARDCNADIQGQCSLTISAKLVWGKDRIRPYVLCGAPSLGLSNVRFNLGIFVATSPDEILGDVEAFTNAPMKNYAVTGYDKMYFLSLPIGDSVQIFTGASPLTNIASLISAATNADPKVVLDQSAAGMVLQNDLTYPLSGTAVRYIDVINDLLVAINYGPLWVDQDGYYRAGPLVSPANLTAEWTFTVQDIYNNLVADPRTRISDTFAVPNWWRFIQNGGASAPTEGSGQYTFTDTSGGFTSYPSRGYYVRKIVSLSTVDQTTLVQVAQQQILLDMNVAETWDVPSGPLPHSGQFDIVNYTDKDIDGGASFRKCQVQNWTFYLDGTEMDRVMDTVLVIVP